jgi:hypothetical protein
MCLFQQMSQLAVESLQDYSQLRRLLAAAASLAAALPRRRQKLCEQLVCQVVLDCRALQAVLAGVQSKPTGVNSISNTENLSWMRWTAAEAVAAISTDVAVKIGGSGVSAFQT